MQKRKSFLPILFLGVLSFIGLLFYIFFIDPKSNISLGTISVSPIILFFILLFAVLSCTGSYLFINIRRGILSGTFIVTILLLRFFGFTSYLYIAILAIIILLLELGFRKH